MNRKLLPVPSSDSGSAGYSLVEILVCCLLVAVLSVIVVGSWISILDWYRLKTAGQSLVSQLALARAEAVSRNLDLCLVVSDDRLHYGFSEPGTKLQVPAALPSGVRFSQVPARRITFHSRGVAVPAGSIVLRNRLAALKVIVPPAGRIRWEFLD